MSLRLQSIEEKLTILNVQMDVLTRFVGYLTSYTVSDDEIDHVKKYVADNIENAATNQAMTPYKIFRKNKHHYVSGYQFKTS